MISLSEASRRSGIPASIIRRYVAVLDCGHRKFVDECDLSAWLDSRTVQTVEVLTREPLRTVVRVPRDDARALRRARRMRRTK